MTRSFVRRGPVPLFQALSLALSFLPLLSLFTLLAFLLLLAAPSRAQVGLFPTEIERLDVIAIERDGRDIFAFDSLTGRRATIRLELGEEILFEASRGRIGLVLTDRRALGVAPGVAWRELRYRLKERVPEIGLVDDRIAMVLTDRRVLGFVSRGLWVEESLSPHESAEALRAGVAVGVVVTNRRALGLAVGRERFVAIDLQVRESLESVNARDTLVTVRTNRRILAFSAPVGTWSEQKRTIN
jgi:hypothetical protein